MKSELHPLIRIVRIVGAFIIMVGMSSPVLAASGPNLVFTTVLHNGGDFVQGEESRSYTITVKNDGDAATNDTITLDTLVPAGLTPWNISGTDWDCPLQPLGAAPITLTCTRTTPLSAGSTSTITLITDVDVNAGDAGTDYTLPDPPNPDDTLNTHYKTETLNVTVSGGGDTGADPDATGSDVTPIVLKPDLRIIGYKLLSEDKTVELINPDPNTSFWVRMTVENRGGYASGLFYPGVFLNGKPNYGLDHDYAFGQKTSFSDFKMTPAGAVGGYDKGCLYYDPAGTINPLVTEIPAPERGNYTRIDYNNSLAPGTSVDVDVHIAYQGIEYGSQYDGIRDGLPEGPYIVNLYVDPNCSGGAVESFENNNVYPPVGQDPLIIDVGSTGIPPSAPTSVNVTISGTSQGLYPMNPDTSLVKKYALDGGPVVIGSNNGVGIIASLNQWRRNAASPAGWFTGVAQSMALPVELITNQYVMPRYNGTDPTLFNAVLMANVDTVPRTITVTIGGTLMGTYTLDPSESVYGVYDITGGPVVVSSDVGAKIIASLYELKRSQAGVSWNGQSEMMGLPASQLSDKYVLPIYFGAANPSTLDARLYIANVDTTLDTTVEVKIAGVSQGTYPLTQGTSMVVKYAVDGGPVEISSNNGAKIVASLNQWRRNAASPAGWFTGVSQSMALPVELITNQYVMPLYNGTDPTLFNAVLMANVDTVPRTITVTIGGTLMGTYTLDPSESVYGVYDITAGPIVVNSDSGAKIIASLYELKRSQAGVSWNGQSEMMGLPASLLSNRYVLPIYFGAANPSTLDARLYIAVP